MKSMPFYSRRPVPRARLCVACPVQQAHSVPTDATLLDTLLEPGKLSVVFQPIFEVGSGQLTLHGLECLIRGPRGTNAERPGVLFEYIRRKRAEAAIDRACIAAALAEATQLPVAARLNLNVHASTLGRDLGFPGFLLDRAAEAGIPPGLLVVEIVEHAPPLDVPAFRRALAELREAGLRLAQSERLAAVGELAAGIAHEANNPVNFAGNAVRELVRQVSELRRFAAAAAALGTGPEAAAEIAKLRAESGLEDLAEAVVELASIAGEGLERTQRLVGDLRDFATPGSGARAPVDLRRGLASTAQLLGYALRQARVELRLEVEPGLPSVEGDARALNQLFLNLLKNAVEALEGRGGTIWVSGRREGEGVRVEVRDDGPGIAPEALARVFEPFHTTKSAGRGTGLGLAISRRIASEHGGSLEAGSAAEGGAAFVLRLPLAGGAHAA